MAFKMMPQQQDLKARWAA